MEANGEVGWKRWRVMCARVRACVWMGVSQWLCDKRPRPSWKLSLAVIRCALVTRKHIPAVIVHRL